jgi:hypothetical protein
MRQSRLLDSLPLINEFIFFPAHSTSHWKIQTEGYDRIAIAYLELNGYDLTNTSICLTNADIQDDRHKLYQSRGYKVFTSGDPYDLQFLSRFVQIVCSHKLVITCEVGSHVFYSSFLGKEVIWLEIFENDIQDYSSPSTGQKSQEVWKDSTPRVDVKSISRESLYTQSVNLLGASDPKSKSELIAIESKARHYFFFGTLTKISGNNKYLPPSFLFIVIRKLRFYIRKFSKIVFSSECADFAFKN